MDVKSLEYLENKVGRGKDLQKKIDRLKEDVAIIKKKQIVNIILTPKFSEYSRNVCIHDDSLVLGVLEKVIEKLERRLEFLERKFEEL